MRGYILPLCTAIFIVDLSVSSAMINGANMACAPCEAAGSLSSLATRATGAGEPSGPRATVSSEQNLGDDDCSSRALAQWLELLQVGVFEPRDLMPSVSGQPTSLAQLVAVARQHVPGARSLKATDGELSRVPLPALAHLLVHRPAGPSGHYVLLLRVRNHIVWYWEPADGRVYAVPRAQFSESWTGHLLVPPADIPQQYWWLPLVLLAAILIGPLVRWLMRLRLPVSGCLLLMLSTFIFGSGCAQRDEPAALSPYVAPPLSDFPIAFSANKKNVGVVRLGEHAEAVFRLTNRSGKHVQLTLGHASSACVDARLGTERLAPGQSTELVLVLGRSAVNAGPVSGSVALGVVGNLDQVAYFEAVGVLEGMKVRPYRFGLPAEAGDVVPPPIVGAVYVSKQRPVSPRPVEIVDIALRDPLAEWANGYEPFLELGEPVWKEPDELPECRRYRFEIPVRITPGTKPGPRQFFLRITYKIGTLADDCRHTLNVFRRLPTRPTAEEPM